MGSVIDARESAMARDAIATEHDRLLDACLIPSRNYRIGVVVRVVPSI